MGNEQSELPGCYLAGLGLMPGDVDIDAPQGRQNLPMIH